jgi:2,3-bisphosphoglycerate-dependent phosphoglycerate mutase
MPAKLMIMRHGRSAWNEKNLFTGWVDIPLDEVGIAESLRGGERIRHIPIDVVFTSTLVRAHMTVTLALLKHASGKVPVFLHPGQGKLEAWSKMHGETARLATVSVYSAWELNERMYGALQGLNKSETVKQFGEAQVQLWRRSYDVPPPEGESLAMTAARTIPYFQQTIVPHLEQGNNVFVAAHGNSLRSIIMHIERLSKEEVVSLEIPTGGVIIYRYEETGTWIKE